MNILDELLTIKKFREDQAEIIVMQKRLDHAEAISAEAEAVRCLESHQKQAIEKEKKLFDELQGSLVKITEIEDVRAYIAKLALQTEKLQENCLQANQQVALALQAVEEARNVLKRAEKVTEKFITLVNLQDEAAFAEAERREDLELEEAAAVARERDEWQPSEQEE